MKRKLLLLTVLFVPWTYSVAQTTFSAPVTRLLDEDDKTCLSAYTLMNEEYQTRVQELIAVVKRPNDASAKFTSRKFLAAAILGEMRAKEAVPVLCDNLLTFNKDGNPERAFSGVDDYYPYTAVLIKIGSPAIPAMMKILWDSQSEKERMLAAYVVEQIEGHEQAICRLQRASDGTAGLQKRRLEATLELLRHPGAPLTREANPAGPNTRQGTSVPSANGVLPQ